MKRTHLAAALLLTIITGYYLRFHAPLPDWLRDSAGGAAYVVCFAIVARFRLAVRQAVLASLLFTCAVEFLQLWRAPMVERVRHTRPGRLLLGATFSWADFPPYAAGAIFAWVVLAYLDRRYSATTV